MTVNRWLPRLLGALLALAPLTARATEPDSTQVRKHSPIYVKIDLDRNMLSVMSGQQLLWAAPAGTGTGLKLEAGRRSWEFSTPNGEYEVLRKELDPVWIKPDWYYHEKGLPVPADTSRERWAYGELGAAAIYFDRELAIHGTSRPELLGQNVSHGCIRISNEDVMRLYHNVRPGTRIVVVGRPPEIRDSAGTRLPAARAERIGTRYSQGLSVASATRSTGALLRQFDEERASTHISNDWTQTAGELVERGAQGDTAAVRGLLHRSTGSRNWAYERELSTFLANLYFRRPREVGAVVGAMEAERRAEVAFSIVRGTMDQYPGSLEARTAPWPSGVPALAEASGAARAGREALAEAERRYRRLFTVPASSLAPRTEATLR